MKVDSRTIRKTFIGMTIPPQNLREYQFKNRSEYPSSIQI